MENVKYRKVKRDAKVGEKIRAVDAKPMWGPHYENGDEFEVVKTRINEILGRRIGDEEGRLYRIWNSEYVVLEPETKITEYRQVKRKAKVGETIKVIRSDLPYYKEKDIAKVYKVFESTGAVLADFTLNEDYRDDGRWFVWLNDYVVFEPIAGSEETDEISDIKSEMERLTGELATLALRVSKLEGPKQQTEKSPQEIRDEIVEKAKADLKGLEDFIRRITSNLSSFYKINGTGASSVEYIVNRKKKTVVCLLRSAAKKEIYKRGIAKCAPGDAFNSHIGRAIALRRALGLEVPAEYLSVPNPTEIREGDIVGYTHPSIPLAYAAEVVDRGSWFIGRDVVYARGRRIIDDSREEGALDAYLA